MDENKKLREQVKEAKKDVEKTKASLQKVDMEIIHEKRIFEGYEKEISKMKSNDQEYL